MCLWCLKLLEAKSTTVQIASVASLKALIRFARRMSILCSMPYLVRSPSSSQHPCRVIVPSYAEAFLFLYFLFVCWLNSLWYLWFCISGAGYPLPTIRLIDAARARAIIEQQHAETPADLLLMSSAVACPCS